MYIYTAMALNRTLMKMVQYSDYTSTMQQLRCCCGRLTNMLYVQPVMQTRHAQPMMTKRTYSSTDDIEVSSNIEWLYQIWFDIRFNSLYLKVWSFKGIFKSIFTTGRRRERQKYVCPHEHFILISLKFKYISCVLFLYLLYFEVSVLT